MIKLQQIEQYSYSLRAGIFAEKTDWLERQFVYENSEPGQEFSDACTICFC
jgi:hypothetical protein